MYGSRGSIGLLVPSVNTVVEPEFNATLPDGYVIHSARMRNASAGLDDAVAMLSHVERASDELGSANVDVVVFACTASSFVKGPEGELKLRRTMESQSQADAVTTSHAVREALLSLNARQISMVTPYVADLNALEVAFLEAAGIAVLAEAGMSVTDAYTIADVDPEATMQLALKTIDPESEALFLSCTNLKTFEILGELERKTGVPVLSSNSATLWATLRALGFKDEIPRLGGLLGAPVAV
jgi:maleate isomerase